MFLHLFLSPSFSVFPWCVADMDAGFSLCFSLLHELDGKAQEAAIGKAVAALSREPAQNGVTKLRLCAPLCVLFVIH